MCREGHSPHLPHYLSLSNTSSREEDRLTWLFRVWDIHWQRPKFQILLLSSCRPSPAWPLLVAPLSCMYPPYSQNTSRQLSFVRKPCFGYESLVCDDFLCPAPLRALGGRGGWPGRIWALAPV